MRDQVIRDIDAVEERAHTEISALAYCARTQRSLTNAHRLQRDAALARAEKAEAERDEALAQAREMQSVSRKWQEIEQEALAKRDEAWEETRLQRARAEAAEAEVERLRGEEQARCSEHYGKVFAVDAWIGRCRDAERERDALRAEVERLRRELAFARRWGDDMYTCAQAYEAEVERLRARVAELTLLWYWVAMRGGF